MKFKLAIIVFLLSFLNIKAQNNTSSPYSMFGLGEIESKASIRSSGMGGAGIAFTSESAINMLNPASYTGIDSSAFIFELGGMGKFSTLKTNSQKEYANDGNFSYVNFGFRAKKWWAMSFGLRPYSNIGYRIDNQRYIGGTTEPYLNTIEGQGGINYFYIGNAFKYKNLSVGVNTSLLFGSLTLQEYNVFYTENFESLLTENTYFLRNIYFDYGIQYQFKLAKLKYSIGATFSNQQKLLASYKTFTVNSSGDSLKSESSLAKDIFIPQYGAVGVSVEIPQRLIVAADYSIQDWSESLFYSSIAEYKMSQSFHFGVEYKPVRKYFKSYFSFVDYRLGAHYSDLYYELYGIPVTEKGISIGFGLPFRGIKIDLSFEYGILGADKINMLEEDYFKFKVGIALKQNWFQKRKFY